MQDNIIDVLIIGGGPGGLTAGMYASRGGANTVLYELGLPGGQIVTSSEIENYPGYLEIKSGMELMEQWPEQAKKFGTDIRMGSVDRVEKKDNIFELTLDSKKVVQAKSVILATGSVPKRAGFKGEDEFFGKGVSTCATCDGFFYKNQEVMTLGGGDTALEEAIFLSNICKKVYLVHRRDTFRAAPSTVARVMKAENIEIIYNAEIAEVYGDNTGMLGAKVLMRESKEVVDYKLPVIFVFVGRNVLNAPIIVDGKPICELNDAGEVVVDLKMRTSLAGLYAIGDVRIDAQKQVVCAAGDGASAAVDAIEYVHALEG